MVVANSYMTIPRRCKITAATLPELVAAVALKCELTDTDIIISLPVDSGVEGAIQAVSALSELNDLCKLMVWPKAWQAETKSSEQEQGTLPKVGDEAAVMVEVVEVDEPTPAVSIPLQYWPFTPELQ